MGWATYNGDQMSMYGVNAGAQTLVRHLVKWVADGIRHGRARYCCSTSSTPRSAPNCSRPTRREKSPRNRGPRGSYELHDFFLYNFIRAGYGPAKILFLAEQALRQLRPRSDPQMADGLLRRSSRSSSSVRYARRPEGRFRGALAARRRRMPSDASAAVWSRTRNTEIPEVIMKEILLAIATLLLPEAPPRRRTGSVEKAATTAADKAADGKLTQYARRHMELHRSGREIRGQRPAEPARRHGIQDNIKQQLDKGYQMAGIKWRRYGHIRQDGKFTTLMGKYELSGTYEFDASTHVAARFAKDKLDLGDRFRGTPTSTALICCWSSPSPNSSTWSRRWAAKYRRWRPSSLLENYKNVCIG